MPQHTVRKEMGWLNRSLLQLLRSYVDKQYDWEQHLPLLLYACRTASHSSTGVNPFVLMMGHDPILPLLPSVSTSLNYAYDPHGYENSLRVKMADLKDLVKCHIAQEAQKQKRFNDTKTKNRSFQAGNTLWLHNPTAGKLDAKWEGGWIVKDVLSPTSIRNEHPSTRRTMVVQINRLQHRYLRQGENSENK